jgi:hypothetical protein
MTSLGAIVEGGDLVQVIWTSLAAGIGVTAVFALAIFGATVAVDLRRDGRPGEATVFGVLGLLALAVVAAALVFGIVVMTQK